MKKQFTELEMEKYHHPGEPTLGKPMEEIEADSHRSRQQMREQLERLAKRGNLYAFERLQFMDLAGV